MHQTQGAKGDGNAQSILLTTCATALPLLLTLCLSSLIGLSDMLMAGTIGDTAQAAIGIADQVLFLSVIMATGLCAGTGACVARASGAAEATLAHLYGRDSLIVATVFGCTAWFIGSTFAREIFSLFGASTEVTTLGVPYLKLCAFGNLPWSIAQCQTAILRARSSSRLSVVQWFATSAISIGAAAILFFGNGSPGYHSLQTLAATWDIGCVVGMLLGFLFIAKTKNDAPGKPRADRVQANLTTAARIHKLLQIAVPVMLAEICWIASNFLMYRIFSSMPDASEMQAAWSIKTRLEDLLATTPLLALSLAAATSVGQNLGAGDRERARQAGWQTAKMATAFMFVLGTALFYGAEWLAAQFSNHTDVMHKTALLLQTSPFVLPLTALSVVLFGGLEGAGVTRAPMAINMIGLIAIRFPLAWSLACGLGMGIDGIWLANLASWLFMGVAALLAFKRPGWDATGAHAL